MLSSSDQARTTEVSTLQLSLLQAGYKQKEAGWSYSQKIFRLEVSKWKSKNSVLKSVQSSCHARRTRFASDITSSSCWVHNFQVQERAHNIPASTYRIRVLCMLRRKQTCVVRAKKRTQCSSWKTSWTAQKKNIVWAVFHSTNGLRP